MCEKVLIGDVYGVEDKVFGLMHAFIALVGTLEEAGIALPELAERMEAEADRIEPRLPQAAAFLLQVLDELSGRQPPVQPLILGKRNQRPH